jgi:hypothetical protein
VQLECKILQDLSHFLAALWGYLKLRDFYDLFNAFQATIILLNFGTVALP